MVSRRPRPATPEQIEAIREWFLNRDRLGNATLVSLLAYVGPRPMEALALHFSDIKGDRLIIERALTNGKLNSTKTGRRRVAELPGPVVQDLRLWRVARGRIDGLIWPRQADGQAWRQADWNNWRRRWFNRAAETAGLHDFVAYDLRHTAASLMIASGRPVTEVANQLGHSPAVSTRTYQHLMEATRGKPVEPMDHRFEGRVRPARALGKPRRHERVRRMFGDRPVNYSLNWAQTACLWDAPSRIRTCGLLLRRESLYPAELSGPVLNYRHFHRHLSSHGVSRRPSGPPMTNAAADHHGS